MQTWPSPISKVSHPISILPSSTQAIFTGIPAWKPVAASGLNVFEIKLSVPFSLWKYAPFQYKEIPPSFLVSWAWSTQRSIILWVAVQCSAPSCRDKILVTAWFGILSPEYWINIERFSPSRANFDLTGNLSAQGVFRYRGCNQFLLHTAKMQVLARWSYTNCFALFLRRLSLCSKLSPLLCDPGSVQQNSAPARLNGLCSAEEFIMWGKECQI